MPRPLPLLAACLAAALMASACTKDDPKPNFSTVPSTPAPTSSSPTPTSSPSPSVPTTGPNVNPGEVAPTEPTTARTRTSEGAIAFVGYYVHTLDWVYATSRPDLLSPFFGPGCSTCRNGQTFIEGLVRSGQIHGGRITIKQVGLVKNDARLGAVFAISANIAVDSASVVSTSGATATSFPPTPDTTLTEWIGWDHGAWKILEERYV